MGMTRLIIEKKVFCFGLLPRNYIRCNGLKQIDNLMINPFTLFVFKCTSNLKDSPKLKTYPSSEGLGIRMRHSGACFNSKEF
jgi:hypothetical protein